MIPLLRKSKHIVARNWRKIKLQQYYEKSRIKNININSKSFHQLDKRSFLSYVDLQNNDSIFYNSIIGSSLVIAATMLLCNYNDNHNTSEGNNSICEMCMNDDNNNNMQNIIATSKSEHNINHNKGQTFPFLQKDEKPSQHFDFIIVGNGNAGRSAVQTLKMKCPNASILVIDPVSIDYKESSNMSLQEKIKIIKQEKIQYILGSAIGFDHSRQTVDIFQQQMPHQPNADNNMKETMKRVRYKHSLLIATGVRGAPPPQSLIDDRAKERILEYRSTQLPSLNQFYLKNGMNVKDKYPVLSRVAVRQIALMAASQGSKVCILGSGIEAIELAAAISEVQNKTKSESQTKKSVSLVFGGAGPLVNILPRYLSTAVSKRLRAHGVNIEDRSLVRYISYSQGDVEVHLVKSFDDLDSKRCKADLVILSPSVSGQQGTAVIPTIQGITNTLPMIRFKSWSKMGESNVISCYSDDGRINVNSELCAASNIYAAGSVAKYPDHITGHASVAGEGIIHGSLAGAVAGRNMTKEYYNRVNRLNYSLDSSTNDNDVEPGSHSFTQDYSLPMLRTDKLSSSGEATSLLSSLGIHALCVGDCDSENMATHGFWWTNHSLQNKRLSRRMTKRLNYKGHKSVFGSGVVFYLDRAASIRGIMIWGIPFTTSENVAGESDLNEQLLNRMKLTIQSNGENLKQHHERTIKQMSLDPSLLSQTHLAEESKFLASLALTTSQKQETNTNLQHSRLLHRYTPAKHVSITSMGLFKKSKPIGNGSVGDDIFERNINVAGGSDQSTRHPSLIHYFSHDWGSSKAIVLEIDEEENEDSQEDVNEYNASMSRPAKEEAVWLRRNETFRFTSMNEKMSDIFVANMKKGQFFDGHDAVKQAPTPGIILNTTEEIERWIGSEQRD